MLTLQPKLINTLHAYSLSKREIFSNRIYRKNRFPIGLAHTATQPAQNQNHSQPISKQTHESIYVSANRI